jgi:hypothetical protein
MNIFDRLLATAKIVVMAASVCAATIAVVASPASAQGTGTAPSARQVIVGGILFLTVRDSWGGLTPEQRALEVQERINHALSIGPIHPSDISVAKVDGDWIVQLRGKRLFTADYDTAKLDQVAPQALAEKWSDFLKETLPGLTAPTNGTSAVTTAPANK